jgi:predicted ribosomally synthesized peptide with SipW-like signal peptide
MRSRTWILLPTCTVVLLLAYSGAVTSGYFSDVETSTDNVLRVKNAPLFGAADSFLILASSTISNDGSTTVGSVAAPGDIGLYPGTEVTGYVDIVHYGTLHLTDTVADQAQTDLTTAYGDAALRTPSTTLTVLDGLELGPGVYHGETLALTGTLTLTGGENAVWIFQTESTLVTAGSSHVVLSGGARAANVYWVVKSSATLGANSTFKGNIMALASITMNTGATVEGRALAQTAAVTLNGNTITRPA